MAKQISLLVDSSDAVMEIKLNMDKARKLANENEVAFDDVVSITGNVVNVRLSQKGGYQYSFFNDVEVFAYPEDSSDKENGNYIFTIN